MHDVKFSTDRLWADCVSMAKAHGALLIAIGGVFLLLPQFAQSLFFPPPEIKVFDESAVNTMSAYLTDNALWFFVLNIPVALGQAAILTMLTHPSKPTVGQALSIALPFLLFVLVLSFLLNIVLITGYAALIVPGVYLTGRLAVAAPAQMAERIANPFNAIARSLVLTRGNGWQIAGVTILLVVVGYIIATAIGAVVGILLTFIMPSSVVSAAIALLQSLLAAATLLALLILSAGLYRQTVEISNKGT